MSTSTDVYDLEITRPPFLGDGKWFLKNLNPITVIFGKNGSGKSILLRNIRDQEPDLRNYSVPERGGEIEFAPQTVNEEIDGTKRASTTKQNLLVNYRQRVIARIQAYLSKRGGMRTEISEKNLEYVENSINELLPDFIFQLKSENPMYSLLRISTNEPANNITLLSSGEAQMLTLSLDLLLTCEMWELDRKFGLLLIDEPDSHIHPDLQQRFAKFIVNLHDHYGCKAIIATHSTTLLSALGHYASNAGVIYLDGRDQYQTLQFDDVMKTLTTCLGGHALMGPLFNFPIILVEGDDDYRIWSEIPRHHVLQIAVIPCNGDEIFRYQQNLEKLFSSLLEDKQTPSGFTLIDGDKTIPQSPQKHIKFIQLNCHESENLFLTDQVLKELGYDDWDSACNKVIQESEKFGEKTDLLKSIKSMDRKTDDFKSIINQLACILDDKNLHWAYRVGKVLGKNRPEEQLADFLGDELVNSLWGHP